MAKRDPAVDAVYKIIRDIEDRRGLKQQWWGIDADVRREIIQTWRKIIRETYQQES